MTGMLDRVLGKFASGPQPQKKRQSSGGAPKGGSLAEALRARGGTQNLQTVINHRDAASDTEAFAPAVRRPARQSMPASKPSAFDPTTLPDVLRPLPTRQPKRSATTDDDIVMREPEANLGWLDLQAFAPRALQKQLERLMETVNSEEGDANASGAGGLAAVSSSAKMALARLPGSERFTTGTAGEIATPRGGGSFSSGSSQASSGLRFALQKRGGVRDDASRAEGELEAAGSRSEEAVEAVSEDIAVQEEDQMDDVPSMSLPLVPVPEDEEVAGVSPVLQPSEGLNAEEFSFEDAAIERTDVSASEIPAVSVDAAEVLRNRVDSASASESDGDTTVSDSADSSAMQRKASDPNAEDVSAEASTEAVPALAVPAKAEDNSEAELLQESSQNTSSSSSKAEAASQALRNVFAQASQVPALQLQALSAPAAEPKKDVAAKAPSLPPPPRLSSEEPVSKIVASAAPQQAKAPPVPPLAQWCPAGASSSTKPRAQETAKEDPEVKPTGTANKFKDAREFWGKHSVRFAGPSLGDTKKISKVEAQAALQRLVSNGAACDPSEVRRLKKLIDM